jgi:hypothetical protein
MPSIATWSAFEFTDNDGSTLGAGSLDVPVIVAASTSPQKYSGELVLAQNAVGTLWDYSTAPATDFTFLYILSNTGDPANGWVVLELETDELNLIGRQDYTIAVAAGVPFILGSSASFANYTRNFGGGTLSKIQRVKVKNLNAAQASISLWLVL